MAHLIAAANTIVPNTAPRGAQPNTVHIYDNWYSKLQSQLPPIDFRSALSSSESLGDFLDVVRRPICSQHVEAPVDLISCICSLSLKDSQLQVPHTPLS